MVCDKSRGTMSLGYPVIGLTPSSEASMAFGCRWPANMCDEDNGFSLPAVACINPSWRNGVAHLGSTLYH